MNDDWIELLNAQREALEAADECLARIEDTEHGAMASKVTVTRGIVLAALKGTQPTREQEWGDGASGEAGAMLRRELRSVIRRYSQESDVTAYQAIGALRMVEHDIVDMLDNKP